MVIWFMLNLNDIMNLVKLRFVVYWIWNFDEVEVFLISFDFVFKRIWLVIFDFFSLVIFFYREVFMFFEYYVKIG